MNMPKSRDIQAKIPLLQAIWNEFWLRYCDRSEQKRTIEAGDLLDSVKFVEVVCELWYVFMYKAIKAEMMLCICLQKLNEVTNYKQSRGFKKFFEL